MECIDEPSFWLVKSSSFFRLARSRCRSEFWCCSSPMNGWCDVGDWRADRELPNQIAVKVNRVGGFFRERVVGNSQIRVVFEVKVPFQGPISAIANREEFAIMIYNGWASIKRLVANGHWVSGSGKELKGFLSKTAWRWMGPKCFAKCAPFLWRVKHIGTFLNSLKTVLIDFLQNLAAL